MQLRQVRVQQTEIELDRSRLVAQHTGSSKRERQRSHSHSVLFERVRRREIIGPCVDPAADRDQVTPAKPLDLLLCVSFRVSLLAGEHAALSRRDSQQTRVQHHFRSHVARVPEGRYPPSQSSTGSRPSQVRANGVRPGPTTS